MCEQLYRDFYVGIGVDYCPPNAIAGIVEMTPSLEQRAAKTREIGALYRSLLEAHGAS